MQLFRIDIDLQAAENLSESLSKQMGSLSMKSPSEEQETVKELFETIGIPYQPSFGSTDMKNVINTPSSKKLVLSNLATNKDQSKKNQASAFKGCEPEMSRRRRDSLDQSWTCSEPPKTIVRRMLLQDVKRPNLNRPFFSMDKENVDLSWIKETPHQTDSRIPLTFTASEQRGIHVGRPEDVSEHTQSFVLANNLSTPTQISEPKCTMLPRNNVLAVPSFGGSCDSSSPTIQTPLTSRSLSSISLATVPLASVSVDLSRSLTSLNTNQVKSTSSASAPPSNQATKHVVPSSPYPPSLNSNLEAPKSEVQQVVISSSKTDLGTTKDVNTLLFERPKKETKSEPEASEKCNPSSASSSALSTNNVTCSVSSNIPVSHLEQNADAPMQFSTFPCSVTSGKTANLDAAITDEDEMEEEAPETSNTAEPSLGDFGGVGISPVPSPSTAKSNPFGGPFSNGGASPQSPPIAFSVPSGELFRPASFTFPSSESSALSQSMNSGAFSGGFSAGTCVSAPSQSVFGQPAQVGSGQQALGSVLGIFGQSRQLGNGLPGSGFAAPSGFGVDLESVVHLVAFQVLQQLLGGLQASHQQVEGLLVLHLLVVVFQELLLLLVDLPAILHLVLGLLVVVVLRLFLQQVDLQELHRVDLGHLAAREVVLVLMALVVELVNLLSSLHR
ncbi:nuclear pore complex protein NUP214 isoform X4 [Prosopis cineraria]|uniref:nuclear pore complex protein NUP214 isoform X4 n=1 Tax=Prosopis cineraria TaxID=364024 RepID=UPI00240F25BD|nr:nuclear pore complex protein NUP214 isoform X4 [Prosopis cineraria]